MSTATGPATDTPVVYIVDDDPGVRDSLSILLTVRGHVTRAFPGGSPFLAAVGPAARGCVLLDLRMPDVDGLAVQASLAQMGVTLPVIILTAHGDVSSARSALRAGAFDFLEKPFDDALLHATIEAALAHDTQARQSVDRKAQLARLVERLTPRERQVLALVVLGKHNREIAVDLGISPRTVEVYKARVMDKLHVDRLPDLVRIALTLDLPSAGGP